MRRALMAWTAAALLAAAAAPSIAEVEIGKPVKEFSGRGFLNSEKFDLESLRGKVVLLQLMHTSSEVGVTEVEHLNKLLASHGEKGLRIVSLFEQEADVVEKWVKDNGVKYPVVYGCKQMRKRYGLQKGFPTAFIVDSHGNAAWAGNFIDKAKVKYEELLAKLTARPWLPEQYADLGSQLDAQDYPAARKTLKAALAVEGLDAESKKYLDKVTEFLATFGKKELGVALKHRDKGRFWEAREALQKVAKDFKGLESGDQAQKALDAILADKKAMKEIEAGDYLREIFPEAQALEAEDPRKAARVLKKVVTKYRGTRAAKRAQELIDRLLP